ncbi:MAG: hypothetical protein Q9164_000590 [Protoblastenia rupestris]
MKYLSILSLVALSSAFVIPDDDTISQIAIEAHHTSDSVFDKLPSKKNINKLADGAESTFSKLIDTGKETLDQAVEYAHDTGAKVQKLCHQNSFDATSWLESTSENVEQKIKDVERYGEQNHDHKPNMTVYELIAKAKYTTKLAALINEYEDLVQLLNGTAANYTIFAPIDRAFEKIPEHAPKPSKEQLKKILLYHISKEYYPAGRILVTHTVPTLLVGEEIGGEAQRLSTNIGLKGLTVNFYSRIIGINFFGTNGVIHGIDSLLVPPPKVADVIQLLPGEFSTLELGLTKTGLFKAINDTSNHVGGTLFAPSNFAFQKLGPKITGFLFSSYGLKYLKSLLEYHVVANQTLYSDAYYKAESERVEESGIPKGYFHVDLPTLLKDKSLSIDVARYGRLIDIRINAFSTVTIEDGIAADGVIHVISNVLIPPKSVSGMVQQWEGEELEIEDLKERLEPYAGFEEL